MEWLSRNFSSSQALEISRQYLLLRTVILLKKVAGVPLSEMEFLKLGTRSKKGGSTGSHFNLFIVIFLSRDRGGEGTGRAAAPPLFCAPAPTFCAKKKNN